MRFLTIAFFALIVLAGCSTVNIQGRTFNTNMNRKAGIADENEGRGFMIVSDLKSICDGNKNVIRSGYFVKPRQPNNGEINSQYENYKRLEHFRVSQCAKVGLWCSTDSKDFCNGVKDCSDRVKNIKQTNCQIEVDEQDRDRFHSMIAITENVGTLSPGSTIMCAMGKPEFNSQLHSITTSTYGWKEDKKQWEAFCLQHKSQTDCDQILQISESTSTKDIPYSKWAVAILTTGDIEVHETKEGILWTEVEVDLSAACGMLEQRY